MKVTKELSKLDKICAGIDRTIGVLSPQSELKRIIARRGTTKVRQYAAARVNRLTGDWLPPGQDINSLIKSSSPLIRARSRQLVRDFPFFSRAVTVLTDYTVGEGIQFQSRVKNSDGKFDKKTITAIEDAVKWWGEKASANGRMHLFELDRLAKRQEVESGEFIFVKVQVKDRKRYSQFALQPYEADWLTDLNAKPKEGNLIDQGIEYSENTGEPVAYHFAIPGGFNSSLTGSTKTVRIAAEHVIHGFETLRPGQLRGISPFATAILVAHDLGDYLDAEMDGAKLAAKYLAFIKSGSIGEIQVGRTKTDNDGRKTEEMQNGIIEYMRPGDEVTIANHNRPGSAFEPYTRFVLRMIAVATGVSYELLSGDYNGINYSNLRGIRNDLAKQFKPHIRRHTFHFSQPVIYAAIESAVLAGRLDLPGFFKNPWRYLNGIFLAPGMESIDPLREGKAWIEQIGAGLRSPQETTAARGRNHEDILDELAEAQKMTEERGLEWMAKTKGTQMQQNPAKVGASEEKKDA